MNAIVSGSASWQISPKPDPIIEDYRRFLIEFGLTEEVVRKVVEDMSDHIDTPQRFTELRASSIQGVGIFATMAIPIDQVIGSARIGDKRTVYGRRTNHSPFPSCIFVPDGRGGLLMRAIKRIARDEELTVDYRQCAQVNGHDMDALQRAIINELTLIDFPVQHYFSNGVYGRALSIPKGAVLVGKIHKHTNLNIVLKGCIEIRGGGVEKTFMAGEVVVSPPGTQRAGFALEDTVWLTVHGTHETDLERIEEMFIAKNYDEYLSFCETLRLKGEQSCLGLQ